MKKTPELIAEEICALYAAHGDDIYFGEAITQRQHAEQAANAANTEGYDDEVQIAALLHDVGHLCVEAKAENKMADLGILDHELEGANYLRQYGFSEKICTLVASHVAAKRYLTFKNPDYYANLSEASKQTLAFQGGKMSADEAAAFEANPLASLIVKMRLWDEAAKLTDAAVPSLESYKDLIVNHLRV